MNVQPISPFRLLQDSRTLLGSIYKPVLLLFIPDLIIFLFISNNFPSLLDFVFKLIIHTLFVSSAIFYVYHHLISRNTTIYNSLKFVISKYLQLVFGKVLSLLIYLPVFLLIIPGIYVYIRLSFVLYAIVIENCSAVDGIKRSWQLVKGKWWSVFWALLVGFILLTIPKILINSFIFGNPFDVGGLQKMLEKAPSSDAKYISSLFTGVLTLILNPIIITYELLLYMNLKALRSGE